MIDKFAEKDAGLDSGSDDSSSDSKPVKKKRKIIIATPRKTYSKPKKQLSDEEEDEETELKVKPVLSDSSSSGDSSESSSDEKKRIKKVVNGKGKTLIGKNRVIKKGKPSVIPKKENKPSNVFSSEEEQVPVDTKDAFADYLGLTGKSSEVTSTTSLKVKEESEDEITCIKEIKTSPTLSKIEVKGTTCTKTKYNKSLENNKINTKSKITSLSDDEAVEVRRAARKRSSRDSSEESSEGESDKDEKSKRISDVELSPDSSEDEGGKNGAKKTSRSAVIVLSEDVPLTSQAEKQGDSDSDDIFILCKY